MSGEFTRLSWGCVVIVSAACASAPPIVDVDPKVKTAMAGCAGSLTAVNQSSIDAAVNKASLSIKAGTNRSNAIETALRDMLSSLPEAERGKAYETYVDCVIRLSVTEGVSLGVSTSIPDKWTLKATIDRLTGDQSSVARFEGCTAEFLSAELEAGKLQALTTAKLIELLPDRLKTRVDTKVSVTLPEPGVYAIKCT